MEYNKNITKGNKDPTVHGQINIAHKNSIIPQIRASGDICIRPPKRTSKASTDHFYVIIYSILLWNVIACINLIFFPFLYYSSMNLGISNKIFITYSTRVTFFVEEVCAINLNLNTTVLTINRFMALYFPYRFANLMNRAGSINEGENEVASFKYSPKNILNYMRQFFGSHFILKKTRKTALILMISICVFSIFISIPYLFYVDVEKGAKYIHSNQNTTLILPYLSCDSLILKTHIKFYYYYKLSKFYHFFSTYYDKVFSIIIYLIPTLLIMIFNISIFIKLKKLKEIGELHSKLRTTSIFKSNSFTTMIRNSRQSLFYPTVLMDRPPRNKIDPKSILPPVQETPLGSELLANDSNVKEETKTTKVNLDKYILTLAIGIEFLLLNLPYVIFVFVANDSWVEESSSVISKAQTIVYFLKHSNHAINVYINIIFNSVIRSSIMFQLNRCYKSKIIL
ncbi:unnamed protein product [Gordionus sp. m RMFG-2023]